MVNVDEGKTLYLLINITAQVRGKVDCRLGAKECAADAADHHQDRRQDHAHHDRNGKSRAAVAEDLIEPFDKGGGFLYVSGAVVDNHGEQLRHQDFADDLHDHTDRSEYEVKQVGLYVFHPFFQG